MGQLALTTAKIAPCYSDSARCETHSVECGETITVGEALYWHTDGTVKVADGNDNDKDEAQFVALQAGLAGEMISALRKGPVYGFTVAAVNVGTVVMLSDTAGDFQTGAGDEPVGRIWALPDKTRVIYFNFQVDADIG